MFKIRIPKKVLITVITIAIMSTIIFSLMHINNHLTTFKVISFEQDLNNIYTLNTLFFEPSQTATSYEVYIYDQTGQLLKIYKTTSNSVKIDDLPIIKGTQIMFSVIAYDNYGHSRKSKNKLIHSWEIPSLQIMAKNIDSDTSFKINILGLESNFSKYRLIGIKDNNKVFTSNLTNSVVNIASSIITSTGYVKFYLLDDATNIIISSLEVGIGIQDITPMKITYPNDNNVKWKDFYITFTGGDYADYYTISIKNWLGQYLLYEQVFYGKEILIKANNFEEATNYKVIIKAYNKLEYKSEEEVATSFQFMRKKQAMDVVASISGGEVRIGEKLRLVSPDNISIYYTIDGSTPTVNSSKYTGPLTILKDMHIKAMATNDNYYSSNIVTYDYKAIKRLPIVYLSPSTQIRNYGVSRAGYTTEREMMNKVTDVIERELKKSNVIVYRNTQDLRLEEVAKISRGLNIDLHLAIHSNAMGTGKESPTRGVLAFVYDETSPVLKLANVTLEGLTNVYNGPKSNCHIVYGKTFSKSIYEINPANFDNSVLLEIGFHDNYDDALWIVNNIENIGKSIASSIVAYYGANQ